MFEETKLPDSNPFSPLALPHALLYPVILCDVHKSSPARKRPRPLEEAVGAGGGVALKFSDSFAVDNQNLVLLQVSIGISEHVQQLRRSKTAHGPAVDHSSRRGFLEFLEVAESPIRLTQTMLPSPAFRPA